MESVAKGNDKEDKPNTFKLICEICGSCYNKRNKARHLKSNKCRQVNHVWVDRFEITR